MNIFDEVDENLFRPLTGINKRKYVDILTLIWDKCKRMPMYAIEKSTTFDMVEDYFYGLDEQVELDLEEQAETDGNIADTRVIAGGFIRRLKETGWLTEKEGEYEEESKLAINYKVVPLLKSFQEIISPTIITYKGKLFKIYSMFEHISEQGSPYEGVLKEASEDFDNLNQALRILSASIEDHINNLTQGKKPEEVLEFFEKYEEKIVVGSYHRFKTTSADRKSMNMREEDFIHSVYMKCVDIATGLYYGSDRHSVIVIGTDKVINVHFYFHTFRLLRKILNIKILQDVFQVVNLFSSEMD